VDINTQNKPQLLINSMDRDMRENIIKFDQKLKGLRAEIDAKVQGSFLYEGDNHDEYVEKLNQISAGINDAIRKIDIFINTVSPQNDEDKNKMLQGEDMKKFYKMVTENLEQIAHINLNF
jgi:hypothetical protein